MVRMRGMLAALMAASAFLTGWAYAEDLDNVKEEIADMKSKVAALEERAVPPAAGGDAESLTALRKKGAIRIGGDVNVDLIVRRRDDGHPNREHDVVDSTEFHTNSANLRFKVEATRNMYLYLKLDLDDTWDQTVDQDDLLEECKFVWNNVRQSNWGLVFGKGEVPYGQDKTMGAIQSYHHNEDAIDEEGPIILLGGMEENADELPEVDPLSGAAQAPGGNPHYDRGRTRHPGEVDNVYMFGVNYTLMNRLRFELAVFQNNDTTGGGRNTRGMHEDRSDDHTGFESLAARLWYAPVEGLRLELSGIKMHNDSAGDRDLRTDLNDPGNAEDDRYAVSFGFDYKLRNRPLEFFGEYQHGWNWAYDDEYDVDVAQLGLDWSINKNVDLWTVGEYLGIDDDDARAQEDYWKAIVGLRYRFDSGLYLILEYAHEWWDGDFATAQDMDADADVVVFRSGWAF